MKIKTIIMVTLIAFTFSCGLTEKFGKKEESVKGEAQGVEVVKPEPTRVEPEAKPVTPPAKMVSVTASAVNIRSGPGMKNKVITTVKEGDEMELLGQSGFWLNVKLSNGMKGWIHKKLVR